MKLEMNDSDYSNDSQSSQGSSTNDGVISIPSSRPILLVSTGLTLIYYKDVVPRSTIDTVCILIYLFSLIIIF